MDSGEKEHRSIVPDTHNQVRVSLGPVYLAAIGKDVNEAESVSRIVWQHCIAEDSDYTRDEAKKSRSPPLSAPQESSHFPHRI